MITGQQFYRLDQGASLWSTLDIKHPNFMFLLREAGYEIGNCRKAWGPGDWKAAGYEEHPCGPVFGKKAVRGPGSGIFEFMEKRDKSKPFCFWLGTTDPHRGYQKDSGKEASIPLDEVVAPPFFPDNVN